MVYVLSSLHLPFIGLFFGLFFLGFGGGLMMHDLLAYPTDGAGNGSLALIKAPRLAGCAHHNLRMDYTAVMWVTIFSNSEGRAAAARWETMLIKLWTVYRNTLLPIKK